MCIFNSTKQIGTSISTIKSRLVTYPSILVCPMTSVGMVLKGQASPDIPPTPDVSKIVTTMQQTVDGVSHFVHPNSAENGVYLVVPTSILNIGTGLWVC